MSKHKSSVLGTKLGNFITKTLSRLESRLIRIESNEHVAFRILEVCLFFHKDGVPECLFTRQYPALEIAPFFADPAKAVRDAISTLAKTSLVVRKWNFRGRPTNDPMHYTLTINKKICRHVRRFIGNERIKQLRSRIMTTLSNELVSDELLQIYVPHILQLYKTVDSRAVDKDVRIRFGELLIRFGDYLYRIGVLQESKEFAKFGSSVIAAAAGHYQPSYIAAQNLLASIYCKQARFEVARQKYVDVVIIQTSELGLHLDTAKSSSNLATVYMDLGNTHRAIEWYNEALRIYEKLLGLTHPDTISLLNLIASICIDQIKYTYAEMLYRRALTAFENMANPDPIDAALLLVSLGRLYDEQSKYVDAEAHYKRALAIYDETLGPDHPDAVIMMCELATLYYKYEKYDSALPLFDRVLVATATAVEPWYSSLLPILTKVAERYEDLAEYEKAELFYQRVVTINEKLLGPDHSDTILSSSKLVFLRIILKKEDQTEPFFRRVLAIDEKKVLKSNDPGMAVLLRKLAEFCQGQNMVDKAGELYMRALELHENTLGDDDLDTVEFVMRLAKFYEDQRRYSEAENLYRQALNMFNNISGYNSRVVTEYHSVLDELREKIDWMENYIYGDD